jgi:hypothetical protein
MELSHGSALRDLLSLFEAALHLPDTGYIEAALGTYAANLLPGDPVWLLICGPPSGGKGEAYSALASLPFIHAASTITEASLLSGTKSDEQTWDASGGLLKEMGPFGILLMKDFTSVLSQPRETRTAVLAALREIYDGSWVRRVGVDGGRCLSWKGKMGFIGAVTEAIDSHHSR